MTLPDELKGLPLDHLGVAVHDLDKASKPYTLVGLPQVGEDEVVASQHVRVRALQMGESLLELLEPTAPGKPHRSLFRETGTGAAPRRPARHDLSGEIARLTEGGARFIDPEPRPGRSNTRVVFLHPKWTGGVLLELVEHL